MTPEQQAAINRIAGAICIETPARPHLYSKTAYVSWDLVLRLRELLRDAGFDLEGARESYEAQLRQEARAAMRGRRRKAADER